MLAHLHGSNIEYLPVMSKQAVGRLRLPHIADIVPLNICASLYDCFVQPERLSNIHLLSCKEASAAEVCMSTVPVDYSLSWPMRCAGPH